MSETYCIGRTLLLLRKKGCGLDKKMLGGIKREEDNRNRDREKRRET